MNRLSLSQAFLYLLKRDLTLVMRNRGEFANPLLFFILVITLFPLAIGAVPELLARIAPGIIWVAALLAAMLSLDSIFRSDFEDGSLEQLLLSAHPMSVLVLAKVTAHWLVTGLPLLIMAPILAEMLGMPKEAQGVLLLTILMGTPVLSLVWFYRCGADYRIAKRWYNSVVVGTASVCPGIDFFCQCNR